jgi:sulfur carrier protein ThiS adenylyltransferase
MRVGIAGAGGIGSNVAFQLVRSGVTCLKIVDFDCIEISNLDRQFYFADQVGQTKAPTLVENLKRIDPAADLEALVMRLGTGNMAAVFRDVDVVVEGFDGAEDKKDLIETFAGSQKMVVAASGVAGLDLDGIAVRRMGNCHIVGDFTTEAGTGNLYAPKVILVAAMMSQIILKRFLENPDYALGAIEQQGPRKKQ